MAFEIDHDWQGNLATPRARIGTSAKTYLLIVLCAIWICSGLIGHDPWKPNESNSISIIKNILEAHYISRMTIYLPRFLQKYSAPCLACMMPRASLAAFGWRSLCL
jgi:4-amino-4-deoxy-L-arabinose transferase-like glycosyltransferase